MNLEHMSLVNVTVGTREEEFLLTFHYLDDLVLSIGTKSSMVIKKTLL